MNLAALDNLYSMIAAHGTGNAMFVLHQQPSGWLDNIKFVLSVLSVLAVLFGIWWATLEWRRSFLTKTWTDLYKYLRKQAKFMDIKRNDEYTTSYTGTDAVKYEIVARLCLG